MEAATHRTGRTLNGTWQFQLDPDGALTPATLSPDRTIPVPLPWQAAFPELQTYSGYAWYRRSFELAADQDLTQQLELKEKSKPIESSAKPTTKPKSSKPKATKPASSTPCGTFINPCK